MQKGSVARLIGGRERVVVCVCWNPQRRGGPQKTVLTDPHGWAAFANAGRRDFATRGNYLKAGAEICWRIAAGEGKKIR